MSTRNTINDELRKALDTSVETTGEVLINEVIDSVMYELVMLDTPLFNRFRKRSWPTNVFKYRQKIALPDAFFLNDGEAFPASDHSEYEEKLVEMKYIYSRVEVTGPEQASVTWTNIMLDQLQDAASSVALDIEETIMFGDSGTNARQFDGLLTQITTNSLDASGDEGVTPTALNLGHLNAAQDLPKRTPDTIVTTKAMHRRIWALLQAQQRFVNDNNPDGGFRIPTYNGMPIFRMDPPAGQDGLDEAVLLVNSRYVHIAIQKELFSRQMAVTRDSDDWFVGMYLTMGVIGENWYHARIDHALDTEPA